MVGEFAKRPETASDATSRLEMVRGCSSSRVHPRVLATTFKAFGGAEGNRTPDLRIANAALSLLSYSPTGTNDRQLLPDY